MCESIDSLISKERIHSINKVYNKVYSSNPENRTEEEDYYSSNPENSIKKEISLLETERKLEREKNEETKVDIENIMRQEKGLPPLDSSKNISENLDEEKNEQIDVLLNEAAEILNDLIMPNENIDIRTVQALKNWIINSSCAANSFKDYPKTALKK